MVEKNELERLSQIGANDSTDIPSPQSLTEIISAISVITDVTFGASLLFSCSSNPAQCD